MTKSIAIVYWSHEEYLGHDESLNRAANDFDSVNRTSHRGDSSNRQSNHLDVARNCLEFLSTFNVTASTFFIYDTAFESPLSKLEVNNFDGLLVLGDSPMSSHRPEEKSLFQLAQNFYYVIQAFHREHKPIAALGAGRIALAKALPGVQLTLAAETTEEINEFKKLGCFSEICLPHDYLSDREHKVITASLKGLRGAIQELIQMS